MITAVLDNKMQSLLELVFCSDNAAYSIHVILYSMTCCIQHHENQRLEEKYIFQLKLAEERAQKM